MQSIRKQLISNYVLVALITVLMLESMFMVVISQYYLGGVERILMTDVETSANFYNRSASQGDIYAKSNYIFENLDMEEKALVEVLDLNGCVVIDNTGSSSETPVNTGDFHQALHGNIESWTGRSELNELIIAVSAPIYDDNNIVGVLRYVSSLEPTYQIIIRYLLLSLLLGATVVAVSFVFARGMSKRILVPIQELVRVTEEVAQGNYKVTAIKYHNDEIGQLVDAVNIMTKEITRADQAKSEFISSISHELRTPLTSIKGWAETMQDSGIQTDGAFYTREDVGTVSIAGGVGVNFRIGYNLPCAMQMTRNLSATYGSGTIRKSGYNPEEASYFIVAGASVDYIARDMFIDGGVFHDFERTCGVKPWQAEGRLGLGVRRKGVDYYAGAFIRSRGYRSQLHNTAMGTFSMTFNW